MPFEFESRQIRVVLDQHGEPWFVAADVCACLDIGTEQIRRLDEDERGLRSTQTPSGPQNMAVVNEPGLFTLVLGSRKPEAKRFKRWVTHEVLPSIRRTGGYSREGQQAFDFGGSSGESNGAPRTYVEALQRVVELQQQLLQARPVSVPGVRPLESTRRPYVRSEHPWAPRVRAWLEAHPGREEVTSTEVLAEALGLKEPTQVQRGAVGRVMSALGWARGRRRTAGGLLWVYTRPGSL